MIPPKKLDVKVIGNEPVARDINFLRFSLPPGEKLEFLPGQYVTFFVTKEEHVRTKSYSFTSVPEDKDFFELLVKRVPEGYTSNMLCDAKFGDVFHALMPLGQFLLKDPESRSIIFVATGTGIAPFFPMLHEALDKYPTTRSVLIVGCRFQEEMILPEDLRALEKEWPSFTYIPVLSRPPEGWSGEVGHVQSVMQKRFPDLSDFDVYICGVPQMVNDVKELCFSLKVPQGHVIVERY
jgi:CDP-4-dehydro-6-deoxyglucose reductase